MPPQSPAGAAPESSGAAPFVIIGELIDAVAAANAKVVLPEGDLLDLREVFECSAVPPQSFSAYMMRFRRYRQVDSLWVQALVLAHRLQTWEDVTITSHTMHRLMLTCFLCATKLNIDNSQANKIVAGHGGVPTSELSFMERCLLILLDWTVHVGGEEWSLIMDNLGMLEAHAAAVRGSEGPAPLLPEALARAIDDLRGAPRAEDAAVVFAPAPPSTSRDGGSGGRSLQRALYHTEVPTVQQQMNRSSCPARRGNRLEEAMQFGRLVEGRCETQPAP
eukprot:TRINITY_DN4063_c0_g1_i9.p1 TRINITY_DN4063_c0_g1~~TRINITY_DN4063_c0_g1_i9.p1  ORF type:complete len:277 (+),score=87.05 TRINITY_DN4063_c0_g1_i9:82-912(+)